MWNLVTAVAYSAFYFLFLTAARYLVYTACTWYSYCSYIKAGKRDIKPSSNHTSYKYATLFYFVCINNTPLQRCHPNLLCSIKGENRDKIQTISPTPTCECWPSYRNRDRCVVSLTIITRSSADVFSCEILSTRQFARTTMMLILNFFYFFF